jgi:peptidylprolyl isomerase
MLRRRFLAAVSSLAAILLVKTPALNAKDLDPENTLVLTLKDGTVLIEMLPALAPKHVAQIKTLVRRGFYDGLKWHRVMEGFMAQTGDPTGTGSGDSDLPNIPAEFSMEPFRRGTVGMARTPDPNSANCQWFICLADARFLDGKYTVWGRVVQGMEFVDLIKKAPPNRQSGMVDDPDTIVTLRVLKDVQ